MKNTGINEIKKETIDKYLSFFGEVKVICDNHKKLHIKKMIDSYEMSARVFYGAVEVGYFRRLEVGLYECYVGRFERIHVRKIIEYVNKKYRKSSINSYSEGKAHKFAKEGFTQRQIANELGISIGSVNKILNSKRHTDSDKSIIEYKIDVFDNVSKIDPQKAIPPNIEWVKEYCNVRKNNIDPQKFIDYYEPKDWMIGKNKMKDWKRAVITWEVNQKKPVTYIVDKSSINLTPQQHWDELKKAGYVIIDGELIKKLT